MENILDIKNLNITFQDMMGEVQAVDHVSFSVKKGEILSLIGESGSGKSVTAKAIMKLADGGNVTGEIWYEGKNILQMKEKEVCKLRGAQISMIFQEPMTALNPVVKIGKQLEEVFRVHKIGTKHENHEKIIETLQLLNIHEPEGMLKKYPYELSGGLRQRIVIAMAVLCRPKLIIADEPTTALDVTTQMDTLLLLKKAASQIGSAVLLITHDLGVVAECADRVIVMYRGKKLEECEVRQFYSHAKHPYSIDLISSRPSNYNGRYYTIKGSVEHCYGKIRGCPYAERCERRITPCKNAFPDEIEIEENHVAACWNIDS